MGISRIFTKSRSPLDINGRKTLVASGVKSIFDPRETADLYVAVSGHKVVFGLVQASHGEKVNGKRLSDPRNVFLISHGHARHKVVSEGFGTPVTSNGSEYIRRKHAPEVTPQHEDAFKSLLGQVFHDTPLSSQGFTGPETKAVRNALMGLGINGPGLTRTGI